MRIIKFGSKEKFNEDNIMTNEERKARMAVALEILDGVYTDMRKASTDEVSREQTYEFMSFMQDMRKFVCSLNLNEGNQVCRTVSAQETLEKPSDTAKKIFEDIENTLHTMFEEYAERDQKSYAAVIEVAYHKLRKLQRKYLDEEKQTK